MIVVRMKGKTSFTTAKKFMLTFFPSVRKRMFDLAEKVMDETRDNLVRAIRENDRSSFIKRMRKLSPKWVARKKKLGYKLHQLAATDAYANAIYSERKGNESVSLKISSGTYPGRTFTYGDLARFFEYGTATMAPLPHWKKAKKYFSDTFKERMKKEISGVRTKR